MPVVSFKVTEEQARELRRAARRKRQTVSEYLRTAAFPSAARPKRSVIIKKHPISGLPYDASPDAVAATEEQIKAALADFP